MRVVSSKDNGVVLIPQARAEVSRAASNSLLPEHDREIRVIVIMSIPSSSPHIFLPREGIQGLRQGGNDCEWEADGEHDRETDTCILLLPSVEDPDAVSVVVSVVRELLL
jgi:hypothetical protein